MHYCINRLTEIPQVLLQINQIELNVYIQINNNKINYFINVNFNSRKIERVMMSISVKVDKRMTHL